MIQQLGYGIYDTLERRNRMLYSISFYNYYGTLFNAMMEQNYNFEVWFPLNFHGHWPFLSSVYSFLTYFIFISIWVHSYSGKSRNLPNTKSAPQGLKTAGWAGKWHKNKWNQAYFWNDWVILKDKGVKWWGGGEQNLVNRVCSNCNALGHKGSLPLAKQ